MINLVLVVPFSLRPTIFPWSVEFLKKAVEIKCPEDKVSIMDFRYDEAFKEIFDEIRISYFPLLYPIWNQLNNYSALQVLSEEEYIYLITALLSIGSELFSIARMKGIRTNSITKTTMEAIDRLKKLFNEKLNDRVKYFFSQEMKTIFGISSQHMDLLTALFIGERLHSAYEEASIIIGGESIDEIIGKEIIQKLKWVDGVVLGQGENVLIEILKKVHDNNEIRDLFLPRLLNMAFISSGKSVKDWCSLLDAQKEYNFTYYDSGVRWDEKNKILRVFPRRGCSWSNCTFCYNRYYFSGEVPQNNFSDIAFRVISDEIIKVIDTIVKHKIKEEERIFINFDSDDNDLIFISNLLKLLSSDEKLKILKFRILAYTQVKYLSKEEYQILDCFKKSPNLIVDFITPIESLNPSTLQNMRKGHHPLQILKAIKLVGDYGYNYGGFYFGYFPLENRKTIKEEIFFVKNLLHLLVNPNCYYIVISYMASTRDYISKHQEKFCIEHHLKDNFWMKKLFGLDLPLSIWTGYQIKIPDKIEAAVIRNYLDFIETGSFLGSVEKKQIIKDFFLLSFLILRFIWITFKFLFFQVISRDLSYFKKVVLLFYLFISQTIIKKFKVWPKFFLKGSILTKDYPWPFSEKWSIQLTDEEKNVLRYLYHPRTYNEIFEKFEVKGIYSKDFIDQLLKKHLKLKSLLQYKTWICSVFNDPEYLNS